MEQNEIIEMKIKKEKIKRIVFIIILIIITASIFLMNLIEERQRLKDFVQAAKSIIYAYPTEETKVCVKVGHIERLSCTYQKYEEGAGCIS